MKNLLLIVVCIVFIGCSSKELSRDKALELIVQSKKYPQVYDKDIFAGDPEHAEKASKTNLEKLGYITFNRQRKFLDDRPYIEFTPKAKPFFLETPKSDQENQVQKIKISDVVLGEVTGVKMLNENTSAVVEYTIKYINITPFVELYPGKFTQIDTVKAYFSLFDDGWRIENKPGSEFM